MYITCGRRGEDYLKELHRYDPDANCWEALADGPVRRAWHGMATLLGKLYVIGGSNNDSGYRRDVHQVVYYSPSTRQWTAVCPLPAGHGAPGARSPPTLARRSPGPRGCPPGCPPRRPRCWPRSSRKRLGASAGGRRAPSRTAWGPPSPTGRSLPRPRRPSGPACLARARPEPPALRPITGPRWAAWRPPLPPGTPSGLGLGSWTLAGRGARSRLAWPRCPGKRPPSRNHPGKRAGRLAAGSRAKRSPPRPRHRGGRGREAGVLPAPFHPSLPALRPRFGPLGPASPSLLWKFASYSHVVCNLYLGLGPACSRAIPDQSGFPLAKAKSPGQPGFSLAKARRAPGAEPLFRLEVSAPVSLADHPQGRRAGSPSSRKRFLASACPGPGRPFPLCRESRVPCSMPLPLLSAPCSVPALPSSAVKLVLTAPCGRGRSACAPSRGEVYL
uniref:Uncharacterized protein n=1 Tax=Sarcophilus harrisii TaxID=9305 RepID=A0A7N4NI03_SARHA